MLRKLRIRMTIICMSILFVIFVGTTFAINALNYKQVNMYADNVLEILSINGGHFGDSFRPDKEPGFSPEVKYETRFFSVNFDPDGSVKMVNVKNIASVTREEAIEMASSVLDYEDDERGYLDTFRYLVNKNPFETQIIFVDCARQIGITRIFVNISIIVMLATLVGLGFLVWFLTLKAVKPIALSYEKQKKFITDAGHELRTPLTIISANAEIIELESGENECTDVIKKQVRRMTEMTKNLVKLSKIDEKENIKDKVDFNLSGILKDVLSNFNKYIETENKEISTDIEDDIIINGNISLIRNLFHILLDNAVKYSITNIYIKLQKQKNKIIFEIKNDSLYIDNNDLNNVFDRFYRSAEVRASNIEGSGIGLSIAKEIILLHKGDIKASSIETNGKNYFLIKIIL